MKNNHTHIRAFQIEDEERVVAIWHACELVRPLNDPHNDILNKMTFQPDLFLVAEIDSQVVGTAMVGYEGHRGWINYLAVDPAYQRQGIGKALMHEAEIHLKKLKCPKINLQVRTQNQKVISFYKSLGYSMDDVVSLGKRLD